MSVGLNISLVVRRWNISLEKQSNVSIGRTEKHYRHHKKLYFEFLLIIYQILSTSSSPPSQEGKSASPLEDSSLNKASLQEAVHHCDLPNLRFLGRFNKIKRAVVAKEKFCDRAAEFGISHQFPRCLPGDGFYN